MVRCSICHRGLNSSYIRIGTKESFKKVGLYCITCDMYYSPDLSKQYTVMQKQYTLKSSNPPYLLNQTGPVGFESMRYMGSVNLFIVCMLY